MTHPDPPAETKMAKLADNVTEFRAIVRAQPITLAILMLGFGYLLGHLAIPRRG